MNPENLVAKELTRKRQSMRGRYTDENVQIHKEYKESGAEFRMSYAEFKKNWIKQNKKKKRPSRRNSKK